MKNNSLKEQMKTILTEILQKLGKPSYIRDVSRYAIENYKDVLRPYDWIYDLRWAASHLKKDGILTITRVGTYSLWSLTGQEGR